jgi:FMN reductase
MTVNSVPLTDDRDLVADRTAPFIVGIGGTARPGSSSEMCLREALKAAELVGANTALFSASALDLPMFAPAGAGRTDTARRLVEAVRASDGVLLASPSYHGGISGLVKNALDYLEDLREDTRPYLDGRAVGCISCAAGWQGSVTALNALREIVHALRGWPTPLGIGVNTLGPLFDTEGACTDEALSSQLAIMAAQVVSFAHKHAAAEPGPGL